MNCFFNVVLGHFKPFFRDFNNRVMAREDGRERWANATNAHPDDIAGHGSSTLGQLKGD